MSFKLKTATLSLIGLILSSYSFSASVDYSKSAPVIAYLTANQNAKVVGQFDAKASGLKGWLIKNSTDPDNVPPTVHYTTADGKYLLAGALVDSAGNNLTQIHTDQYAPKNYKPFISGLVSLPDSAKITTGSKNPKAEAIVIFDSKCGFCHKLMAMSKQYEKSGLAVTWVPVSILGSAGSAFKIESERMSGALLSSGKKVEDFESLFRSDKSSQSALLSSKSFYPTKDSAKRLAENTAFFMQYARPLDLRGTPVVLFKSSKTNNQFQFVKNWSIDFEPLVLNSFK